MPADPTVAIPPQTPLTASLPVSGGEVESTDNSRRRSDRPAVIAAGLLTVFFTLLCVQWSFARGRLSQDVTYDDSMYMFEAGRRLAVFYDKGLTAYVANLWKDPPHAPFTDFGAEFAFSLFGLHDWVPYVFVNGPVIFLLLLAVAYFGRAVSLRARIAMMVFALSLPLTVLGLHEYRPDFPGALFTALGICLVIEAVLFHANLRRERQLLVAGGLFFGLALVTKAVFFVHTLTMEGLTIAGATGLSAWSAGRPAIWKHVRRRFAMIAALVALPSLAVAAPYFLVNLRETFGYFYDFALGAHSHVSELKGGLAGSAYFYTFGYAGSLMLGRSFFVGLALYGLCLGGIVRLQDRRELIFQVFLLVLAAVSLGSIIVNKRENQYFGVPADLLLLFMLLRAVAAVWPRWCATRRGKTAGLAVLSGLCVANLCLLNPAMLWPYSVPPLNYVVHRDHSLNQQILDDLWREFGSRAAIPAEPPLTFVTRGGFVTAPTFRWLALKAGRRLDFSDVWTDTNPEAFRKGLQEATFVVAPEDNAAGVYNQNAAWELRFEVERMMAAIPGLRLLHRYPDSPGGPAYRLFVNDDRMLEKFGGFGDFQALEGFLPWEGPYPQWNLGRVRWAVGPKTRFAVLADATGAAVLRFSVRADQPVRATLRQGGASLLAIDLPGGLGFQALAVPVKVQAGANEFALNYENTLVTAADGFQRALLFRQLDLQAKP